MAGRSGVSGIVEATRRDPEDDGATLHHGGAFQQYMHWKNVKLREQFEAQALTGGQLSNLFQVGSAVRQRRCPKSTKAKQWTTNNVNIT